VRSSKHENLAKRTQFLFAVRATYCFNLRVSVQPAAGVEFIDENGGGPGVRLPSKAAKAEAVRTGERRSHVDGAIVSRVEVLVTQSSKTVVRPDRVPKSLIVILPPTIAAGGHS
jgi:hypothetical protein